MSINKEHDFVLVPLEEYNAKKGEIIFGAEDMMKLIESKDVRIKYLKKSINKFQSDLGALKYVGKEGEAYAGISTLQIIINSVDGSIEQFKTYTKVIAEQQAEIDRANKSI